MRVRADMVVLKRVQKQRKKNTQNSSKRKNSSGDSNNTATAGKFKCVRSAEHVRELKRILLNLLTYSNDK